MIGRTIHPTTKSLDNTLIIGGGQCPLDTSRGVPRPAATRTCIPSVYTGQASAAVRTVQRRRVGSGGAPERCHVSAGDAGGSVQQQHSLPAASAPPRP
eukprot:3696992-Pyramimonas_sp.AAC.2